LTLDQGSGINIPDPQHWLYGFIKPICRNLKHFIHRDDNLYKEHHNNSLSELAAHLQKLTGTYIFNFPIPHYRNQIPGNIIFFTLISIPYKGLRRRGATAVANWVQVQHLRKIRCALQVRAKEPTQSCPQILFIYLFTT
jgi:hypothetical protein